MPSDEVKLQMHGIEEMTKNLEKFGTRFAISGPPKAVRAAGTVAIKEMRRRAPRETGSLKKAIGQKVKTYRRNKTVTSIVGVRSKRYDTKKGRRNPANYHHLVEGTVKPHKIGSGIHPGTSAQPFMRPGWDAAAPAARQAAIDKMKDTFEKEAARVAEA
jgi:HK97 gp10 family phage protein